MTGAAVIPVMGPVTLPSELERAIVAQARAESPNEACGLIVGTAPAADGGVALRYEACRNAAASPVRYAVHPDDLYQVTIEADEAGHVIWGIVHSHPRSPAVPSATDVGMALYPDALYLLVSLAAGQADPVTGAPLLRAWRIVGGAVREVALEVA